MSPYSCYKARKMSLHLRGFFFLWKRLNSFWQGMLSTLYRGLKTWHSITSLSGVTALTWPPISPDQLWREKRGAIKSPSMKRCEDKSTQLFREVSWLWCREIQWSFYVLRHHCHLVISIIMGLISEVEMRVLRSVSELCMLLAIFCLKRPADCLF